MVGTMPSADVRNMRIRPPTSSIADTSMMAQSMEGGKELDGLSVGEVALQTLARRCTGDDAHLERSSCFMLAHGTLRQFAYHSLGYAVGCKSAESDVVTVVYHSCPFGSSNLSVCHILIIRIIICYLNLYIK